jgi:hypothetical protein
MIVPRGYIRRTRTSVLSRITVCSGGSYNYIILLSKSFLHSYHGVTTPTLYVPSIAVLLSETAFRMTVLGEELC